MSRVVVVTGASAGVGRAVARAFAARGDAVALLARGRDGLAAAAREVSTEGGRRALPIAVDVADAEAVDAAADRVERELGPVDVWVNNAMVSVFAPFEEISPADYRRVTEVSYLGYVHGTGAALRRMLPRGAGTVVQVGSALAYRAIPLQSAYCGAKHAVEGFTESLRCELAHAGAGVRVTMVHLPAVNTPQFRWVRTTLPRRPRPVPPIFQPEVAAESIVWAADRPRREYWVGWPTARAILGNRVAPGLLDRYLARTGFDAQQGDLPLQPGRRDNLYEPVAGDPGTHGDFDEDARTSSLQWRAARSRPPAAAVAGLALVLANEVRRRRWRRQR